MCLFARLGGEVIVRDVGRGSKAIAFFASSCVAEAELDVAAGCEGAELHQGRLLDVLRTVAEKHLRKVLRLARIDGPGGRAELPSDRLTDAIQLDVEGRRYLLRREAGTPALVLTKRNMPGTWRDWPIIHH